MHYLKFRSLAKVLFFSSLVLILAFLAFWTTAALLFALWQTGNESYVIPLAISGATTLVLGLLQSVLSSQTACQLCQTLVLREFKCSKSPNAHPLFGSYRLKVAASIIFTGKFRCPYCGETFNIWAQAPKANPTQSGASITRKAGRSLPSKKQ